MTLKTIAGFETTITSEGFGNVITYTNELGTFDIRRKDELNYYGNPVIMIVPIGYIEALPKLTGFRRNNSYLSYSLVSYDNFDNIAEKFFNQLKGKKLYVNR